MKEDERNNTYWVNLSSTLHDQVDFFYDETCYDSKGNPKDANSLDSEQITAILEIMSEIYSAVESGKKKITIEDIEEVPYKK